MVEEEIHARKKMKIEELEIREREVALQGKALRRSETRAEAETPGQKSDTIFIAGACKNYSKLVEYS